MRYARVPAHVGDGVGGVHRELITDGPERGVQSTDVARPAGRRDRRWPRQDRSVRHSAGSPGPTRVSSPGRPAPVPETRHGPRSREAPLRVGRAGPDHGHEWCQAGTGGHEQVRAVVAAFQAEEPLGGPRRARPDWQCPQQGREGRVRHEPDEELEGFGRAGGGSRGVRSLDEPAVDGDAQGQVLPRLEGRRARPVGRGRWPWMV